MFCYTTGKQPTPEFFTPYHKMNATKAYLHHYGNFLYLRFILHNDRSTNAEKRQAQREIDICDRKLNWWYKHPNLNKYDVEQGTALLRRQWGVKR